MQPSAAVDLRTALGARSDRQPAIRAYTLDAFLAMQIPAKAMLLAPWLPEAGIAMIFAPRGIGKTYLALGVAYAVATGGEFLRWKAPTARRVLVIDGEMPAATQQERWSKLVKANDKEPPSGDYVRILASDRCEFGLPDLSTEDGQRAIEPHIGDADLIIIDNLSTLARSGKENESESWGCIQDWALRQRRQGRSIVFIHHAGKGGEQRGTSKREDIMDSVINRCRAITIRPMARGSTSVSRRAEGSSAWMPSLSRPPCAMGSGRPNPWMMFALRGLSNCTPTG
jgi:RecA-family ATPase